MFLRFDIIYIMRIAGKYYGVAQFLGFLWFLLQHFTEHLVGFSSYDVARLTD